MIKPTKKGGKKKEGPHKPSLPSFNFLKFQIDTSFCVEM